MVYRSCCDSYARSISGRASSSVRLMTDAGRGHRLGSCQWAGQFAGVVGTCCSSRAAGVCSEEGNVKYLRWEYLEQTATAPTSSPCKEVLTTASMFFAHVNLCT